MTNGFKCHLQGPVWFTNLWKQESVVTIRKKGNENKEEYERYRELTLKYVLLGWMPKAKWVRLSN